MKFSVIIPVFNKADTIPTSLNSVFAQTYRDFEIIVVNDGSTDNIQQVLSQYEGLVVINQENAGVSAARNAGINKAQGEYLCFLDADDIYFPNHLAVLNELINKYTGCGFYCTSHIETFADGRKLDSSTRLPEFIIKSSDYKCGNLFEIVNNYSDGIIHTNSFCIKKDILVSNDIYFAVGEKLGEDTDLWYRVALKNSIVLTKIATTQYRREFSTATKFTSNPPNWAFAKRKDEILTDKSISDNVKKGVLLLLDRYFLKCARDNKFNGEYEKSILELRKATYRWNKRYLLTALYCHLPWKVSKILKKYI
ncbi:MAG: glycosyltransferase family 2 protein [Bacteroidaceae bacterium]|nr:glycosyltransferase family 2 protein [Bacteroidaceae bacterium]